MIWLLVALACCAASHAEPLPKLGVLLANPRSRPPLEAALNALGLVDGKSVVIDWRITTGGYRDLSALAAALVAASPAVILASGDAASRAAVAATRSIPIVFVSGDPVLLGYVDSVAHPERNATGTYVASVDLEAKRLEMAMELAPNARRIAYLYNPDNPLGGRHRELVTQAAAKLKAPLKLYEARSAQEIEVALAGIVRARPGAAFVSTDVVLSASARRIAGVLRDARIATVYPWRAYLDGGGLIYYGVDNAAMWRKTAGYVDKILKGARPADLPVEQLSQFELVIDLRAAQRLGIEVPQSLRQRATEVIR